MPCRNVINGPATSWPPGGTPRWPTSSRKWRPGGRFRGCDADDACRTVIEAAGGATSRIARAILLGTEGHGNGANLDNLETNDTVD